jgi:hypothetical protein
MDKCVRNLSLFTGCSLGEAIKCATYNPAKWDHYWPCPFFLIRDIPISNLTGVSELKIRKVLFVLGPTQTSLFWIGKAMWWALGWRENKFGRRRIERFGNWLINSFLNLISPVSMKSHRRCDQMIWYTSLIRCSTAPRSVERWKSLSKII